MANPTMGKQCERAPEGVDAMHVLTGEKGSYHKHEESNNICAVFQRVHVGRGGTSGGDDHSAGGCGGDVGGEGVSARRQWWWYSEEIERGVDSLRPPFYAVREGAGRHREARRGTAKTGSGFCIEGRSYGCSQRSRDPMLDRGTMSSCAKGGTAVSIVYRGARSGLEGKEGLS